MSVIDLNENEILAPTCVRPWNYSLLFCKMAFSSSSLAFSWASLVINSCRKDGASAVKDMSLTYLDVCDELDRLAILSKLFRLDVLEDGHTIAACKPHVESVRREAP